MGRFNTLEEVAAWAARAAAADLRNRRDHGADLNPYCTPGARNDWQRGYDNAPARAYDLPGLDGWCTKYQRGRAVNAQEVAA